MKKMFILIVLSLMVYGCGTSIKIPSPNKDTSPISIEEEQKIQEATEYHDKGDYQKAINLYSEILKNNPDNVLALYEMSYTLSMVNDYKKSLEYSLKGMEYNSKLLKHLYITAGNSLDNLGKSIDAISLYKKGIEQFPEEYLLYYNMAVSHFNINNYKETEEYLIKALKLNPLHSSSHLALAGLYKSQEKQIPSLLHYFRFLILEPNTNRSKQAVSNTEELMSWGVNKKDSKNIDINMFSFGDPDSPYSMMEMTLKLIKAASYAEENKGKSAVEIRVNEISSLISLIEEQKERKNFDFTASHLFPYFSNIKHTNNVDAFIYFIYQSVNDKEISEWLKQNETKVNDFLEWNKNYLW